LHTAGVLSYTVQHFKTFLHPPLFGIKLISLDELNNVVVYVLVIHILTHAYLTLITHITRLNSFSFLSKMEHRKA